MNFSIETGISTWRVFSMTIGTSMNFYTILSTILSISTGTSTRTDFWIYTGTSIIFSTISRTITYFSTITSIGTSTIYFRVSVLKFPPSKVIWCKFAIYSWLDSLLNPDSSTWTCSWPWLMVLIGTISTYLEFCNNLCSILHSYWATGT